LELVKPFTREHDDVNGAMKMMLPCPLAMESKSTVQVAECAGVKSNM